MFYIDFTSPEGMTYRIDVSKNPVIYECPVCGEKTIYKFDSTHEDCCGSCVKRRQEEEEKMLDARLYKQLAYSINLEYKSNISPDDVEYYMKNPQLTTDDFKRLIKKSRRQNNNTKLAPNVTKIKNPNYRPSGTK